MNPRTILTIVFVSVVILLWFIIRCTITNGDMKTGFPKLFLLGEKYRAYKD